jgi:predicted DsbA family dithiol-disulfide isomerase
MYGHNLPQGENPSNIRPSEERSSTTQQQNWKPKYHTKEEVQNARRVLYESREEKGKRINRFVNDRSTNPFKGEKIDKLVELAKNNDATLNRTLEALQNIIKPRDFTSSELGMTYAEKQGLERTGFIAQQDEIYKKLSMHLTSTKLQELMREHNITGISQSKMRDLILLDDFWPDFW